MIAATGSRPTVANDPPSSSSHARPRGGGRRRPKAAVTQSAPGTPEFVDAFAICQRRRRYEVGSCALMGALTGIPLGLTAGIIAAPATMGLSIPFGTLIGGWFIGPALGAALGTQVRVESRPDDLRLHAFADLGIVPRRRDSEAIVKALKVEGVLARGRGRRMLSASLSDINRALDRVQVGKQPLSQEQRRAVCETLAVYQNQLSRHANIRQRLKELDKALEARRAELTCDLPWYSPHRLSTHKLERRDETCREIVTEQRALRAELELLPSECDAPAERDVALPPPPEHGENQSTAERDVALRFPSDDCPVDSPRFLDWSERAHSAQGRAREGPQAPAPGDVLVR